MNTNIKTAAIRVFVVTHCGSDRDGDDFLVGLDWPKRSAKLLDLAGAVACYESWISTAQPTVEATRLGSRMVWEGVDEISLDTYEFTEAEDADAFLRSNETVPDGVFKQLHTLDVCKSWRTKRL
jgi:hypothetical protein